MGEGEGGGGGGQKRDGMVSPPGEGMKNFCRKLQRKLETNFQSYGVRI